MEIRILGPIEATAGGEALPLGGLRERALLAVMALSPGRVLGSDRLIDELWGEDLPANPANALQALVSRLRRSVGAEVIVTRPPGYVLDVPPDAVDAVRFRTMVAAARHEPDPAERGRRYRQALALWRGPALAEFTGEESLVRERALLEELRLQAVESRIAADLEVGDASEVVPELERLIADHPLREGLRASHMLALYRQGRQADALRAYTEASRLLGEELGIEPGPELRAMEEAILMQEPRLGAMPVTSPRRVAAPALPARIASFVGRTEEMAEVRAAFGGSRLVTLTGAGGAGKTSLAIEAARALEQEYPDGVWLIELAPVMEATSVPDALVAALHLELGGEIRGRHDLDPLVAVVEFLRHRSALLILDNCEHVVHAAAAAAEQVLLACPAVDVLATSRDRLGIPGEVLWRVPPLGVGDDRSDAVTLFVERARAVNPSFAPDADDVAAVADICRRVDGMPLAIELAAARTRTLAVHEIARRLHDGIGVLSGGPRHGSKRQQTLAATIDWSYRLLRSEDRELFARLAAFRNSFSLEAAENVAPTGWTAAAVLESMERLIDASMVAPVAAVASMRYRLLDTLAAYASERLAETDETDEVIARLLDHYLGMVADAEDGLRGPEQLEWIERIEADLPTVRSVLDWAASHEPTEGLRLAGMLGWFWYLRGSGQEARQHFETLLDAVGEAVDARTRAQALFFRALHDPHIEAAREDFEAARDAYLEAGDTAGVAHSLAMMAAWGFDRVETGALIEEAAALCAESGYAWGAALISFLSAGVAAVANDVDASARFAEDAATRFAALGDRWGQGYSLYSLGVARRAMGDYPGASAALLAALDHARPMRLRREMAPVLSELASIAMMQGEFAEAASLLARAREYADEVPFAGSQGMVRNAQGRLARLQGDHESARRLHREAVALYEESRNPGGLAYSLSCLGFAEEWGGDFAAATRHHLDALHHAEASGDVFAVALALEGVGAAAIVAGDAGRGVTLVHAGLALREAAGVPLPPGEWVEVERAFDAAQHVLTADEMEAARQSARRLDLDQATALARQQHQAP